MVPGTVVTRFMSRNPLDLPIVGSPICSCITPEVEWQGESRMRAKPNGPADHRPDGSVLNEIAEGKVANAAAARATGTPSGRQRLAAVVG